LSRFWLGPVIWSGTHWHSPAGVAGWIDLRSVAACAQRGGSPSGFGIFVTADGTDLGSSYENLGTDPQSPWGASARARWKAALDMPQALQSNTLRGALWETLTIQSDPIGDYRVRPIMPTEVRQMECWLAGGLLQSKRFRVADPESTPVLDLLRRQYRKVRQDSLEGRCRNARGQVDQRHYLKFLGYLERQYGIGYRAFQSANLPDEAPLTPETTLNETFNTADSTTLGPVYTWTEYTADVEIDRFEVAGNQVACDTLGGADQAARANADLSGANHYAQLNVTALGAGGNNVWMGAAVRFSSSVHTCYFASIRQVNDTNAIYKIVAGVSTELGTPASVTVSLPAIVKCQADGTTLKSYWDGAETESITDSAIDGVTVGGLRCGIQGFNAFGDLTNATGDSWEAADLGGAEATPISQQIYIGL
jgi:hypothetical protein